MECLSSQDWWGVSCNIDGHVLTHCLANSDTTVNMGADGKFSLHTFNFSLSFDFQLALSIPCITLS